MSENHSTRTPTNVAVVDTETIPIPSDQRGSTCTHVLRLGVARGWRNDKGQASRHDDCTFRDVETFWAWLDGRMSRDRPLWLFAHNLGFDLSVLKVWERFQSGDLQLEAGPRFTQSRRTGGADGRPFRGVLVTEDPPTLLIAQDRQGRTLRCADTLNWFMCSLATLGSSVGLEKLPMPGELADDNDWLTYCQRDVDVLEKVVKELIAFTHTNDLGVFKMTAASQAMHLFRHKCLDCAIVIDTDREPKRLDRLCYHGPRCSVYFAGAVVPPGQAALGQLAGVPQSTPVLDEGPVYVLDLTAAYPAVMASNLFPTAFRGWFENISPDRLRGLLRGLACLAEVTIEDGADCWPHVVKGERCWDRGRFVTHLCGPELIRALDRGVVQAVHRVTTYTQDRPFGSFCKLTWAMRERYRKEDRPLWATLCKTLANALHGKFGQRTHEWDLLPGQVAECPWGTFVKWSVDRQVFATFRSIAHHVQAQGDGDECAGGFPAIAAYTTAYHREMMRQARTCAGPRDTLYESADTLHVTSAGYRSLHKGGWIADHEPGKFRVVSTHDLAIYYGPKCYKLDSKLTVAGVSSKAIMDARGMWHQTNFLRLDSLLSHDRPEGPVSFERTIEAPAPQVRGVINPDGWVDPILYRC